jgi:hypothetical protein
MDLNHTEQSHGGAYVPVAILPRSSDILLAKMEARLPLDIFEEVRYCCASQRHLTTRHCSIACVQRAVTSCVILSAPWAASSIALQALLLLLG